MSHGVAQTQRQARSEEERAKELKQIEAYRSLDAQVRAAITAGDFSQQAFDLISKLLKENPEYYTVWNYRRRILLHDFLDHEDQIETSIQGDLEFLFPLLRKFPKCYWIWNHRRWLLAQASKRLTIDQATRLWQEELALDSKMLSRDSRNFHAWSYRRSVTGELEKLQLLTLRGSDSSIDGSVEDKEPVSADEKKREALKPMSEEEFKYTTQMVRGNLSNFSAWHQRSVLLPTILQRRQASAADRRKMFDSELAFVKDAAFVDPWDQSLWFYHGYLMKLLLQQPPRHPKTSHLVQGSRRTWVEFTNHDRETYLRQELEEIAELLEDSSATDCKWIYQRLLELTQAYLDVEAGNRLEVIKTQNLRHWLARLRSVDPLRNGRWDAWGEILKL